MNHSLKSRSVVQMDEYGNIIEVFPSIASAARATCSSKVAIGHCLAGREKRTNGFKWRYANDGEMHPARPTLFGTEFEENEEKE